MLYKTIPICTISFLTGIGLMLLMENVQLENKAKSVRHTKQLIERNNGIMEAANQKVVDSASDRLRKGYKSTRKVYTPLYSAMRKVETMTDSFIKKIKIKQEDLEWANQLNVYSRYKVYQKIDASIQQKVHDFNESILSLIQEVSKNRNLGIKPREIEVLTEMTFESLVDNTDSGIIENKFNYDLASLELAKLENHIRVVEASFVNYLASKIGRMTLGPPSFFAVQTFPKKNVIKKGETFESTLHLTTVNNYLELAAIKVDGVPLKKTDYRFENYKMQTNVRGEHQYSVEIQVENPFTGKKDRFTETFSYYVK